MLGGTLSIQESAPRAAGTAVAHRLPPADRGVTVVLAENPAFGVPKLVDVAIRALSPAVNDPTTGVQAIDRLSDLLAIAGSRPDPTGLRVDSGGTVRLKRKLRNFEGLLVLALT